MLSGFQLIQKQPCTSQYWMRISFLLHIFQMFLFQSDTDGKKSSVIKCSSLATLSISPHCSIKTFSSVKNLSIKHYGRHDVTGEPAGEKKKKHFRGWPVIYSRKIRHINVTA